MREYKQNLMAVLLVLMLPFMTPAAHAGVRSFGSSHAFRGGFSSQRARPFVAPSRPAKSSFGSFGRNMPSDSAGHQKSGSALNRDLEKNQAQANALKNFDARNNRPSSDTSNVTGHPLPPARDYSMPAGAATYHAPAAPTVIVQKERSSMSGAFWGFMLGSAMSRPHAAPAPDYDRRSDRFDPLPSNDISADPVQTKQAANNALVAAKPVVLPSPATSDQTESSAWEPVRFLLWGLILFAIAWVLLKFRQRHIAHRAAKNSVHYSLGKG